MLEPRITTFTLTLEMLPPTSHLIMCRATEVKTKLKTASMLKTQLAIQMKVFGSTATPALQQVKKLDFFQQITHVTQVSRNYWRQIEHAW